MGMSDGFVDRGKFRVILNGDTTQVLEFRPALPLFLTSWEKMVSGHRGGGRKIKTLIRVKHTRGCVSGW